MSKGNNNRRDFLGKLTFGLISMASLPAFLKKSNSLEAEVEPILHVKPMGFMWDTLDPFLFCVHHEDHFPKGNEEMGPAVSLKGRSLGDDFIIKDGFRMYHGKKYLVFPDTHTAVLKLLPLSGMASLITPIHWVLPVVTEKETYNG
ncbi:MAG: hypothetical protein R2778_06355 [Saprospiraceae bacterium]